MTQFDCWRENENPHWLRLHDDNDVDNEDDNPPHARAEGILACGHDYDEYCKCDGNPKLESELYDYHWRML